MILTGWDLDWEVSSGLHGKLTKDSRFRFPPSGAVWYPREMKGMLFCSFFKKIFRWGFTVSFCSLFWGNIHSGEHLWVSKTYKVLPVTKWFIPPLYPQETFNTAKKRKQSVTGIWRKMWNLVRHPKSAGGRRRRKDGAINIAKEGRSEAGLKVDYAWFCLDDNTLYSM